ncbi:MAG TPA: NUDIX domain-containing protein [Acidimicrobiales bacterium]|jgi:8-oxo-dGTP pyrophosphatase MutT (NUDIX family)|nr:NUDIX domain-containing protein [Acidimicrobiales bacterium]
MSDPVASLRIAVEAHHPGDLRELASRDVFLTELDRLPHPFDERYGPVHVTSSGVVFGPRGVILVMHRRLHRWMQPGGHIEPGETPEVAVVRECTEETGLTVNHPTDGPILIHLDVHEASKGHTHLDVRYLIMAPDEDPHPPEHESQQIRWFSWDEASAIADQSLQGALRVARSLVGTPEGGDRSRQTGPIS